MTEEITASSTPNMATYLPAFKWARHTKRWARRALYGVAILGATAAVWIGVSDGKVEARDILAPSLALGFLGLAVRRSRDVNRLCRQIEEIPGYGETFTWTIKEDGYGIRVGETQAFMPWKELLETIATPEGVLIYVQKNAFEWLPKTAFTTESDYIRFLALVASKTKHSKIG